MTDGENPESFIKPTSESSRVVSMDVIEGVFDTVRSGLEAELDKLVAARPDKLSPLSEQIAHGNQLAKNIGGQEAASLLQRLILGEQ